MFVCSPLEQTSEDAAPLCNETEVVQPGNFMFVCSPLEQTSEDAAPLCK